MVSRRGADPDRQLDAGTSPQLAGVHTRLQPGRPASGEDGARLVSVERPALAEDVDPPGMRRAGAEHRTADQVDVAGRARLELRRHHVRAEIGDLRRDLSGKGDAASLVADGEAVTGLALERRDPLGQHLGCEPAQVGPQLGVAGSARGCDRAPDAAGAVGDAGHPGRELCAPFAGEDQVRVRVDEARQHCPAAGVNRLVGGRRPHGRARPCHQAVADHQGRVPLGGQAVQRTVPRARDQLADVRYHDADGSTFFLTGVWTEVSGPNSTERQVPLRPPATRRGPVTLPRPP